MYKSHVQAVASAAHSNGPEGQKCFTMHGHDFLIEVGIEYDDLDAYGWGPSFGAIKDLIREYDHKNLNEELAIPASAENIARIIYDRVVAEILGKRGDHWDLEVTVHEGDGNYVTFTR